MIHVSDIHGDSTRFNSAYDYADYLGTRLVVDTGDNPFFRLNQQILFHEKVVFSHKTDFVNCVGNHDTYGSANEAFNKNIAPFAENYSYHKSNSSDITDKCYFYKDLADCNLRIIAMDIYDGIVEAAYKARISSAQFNWFIATLSSTPSGYGVIVILHQAPHSISAISGKTDFNDSTMDPQIGSIDSDYMSNGKITGNPFGKVIDAFIGKTTVSGSYTQKNAAFTDNETISYEADFSNVAEGVEFIAYLNGHTHRDHIGYVSDCVHNQLNMNVCSVSPISQSTGYKTDSDIMRDSNGPNQDAFNVYTIDRENKRVGIARVLIPPVFEPFKTKKGFNIKQLTDDDLRNILRESHQNLIREEQNRRDITGQATSTEVLRPQEQTETPAEQTQAENQTAETPSAETPVLHTSTDDKFKNIKPIGRSFNWGNIYNWTTGKVKDAFEFLRTKKEGYLKGVFHRDDIGDIDLGWGEANNVYNGRGLKHIILKHVDFLGDFSNIEELQKVMTDVVENGELKDDNDKTCAIEKGNYRVVVVKDSEGNWILSAFDFITPKKEKIKRKDAATHDTPGQPNVEAGAVTSNLSISKDIQNSPIDQTNSQETDSTTRFSSPEQRKEYVENTIGQRLSTRNYGDIKKINPFFKLLHSENYRTWIPYRDVFTTPTVDDYYIGTKAEFTSIGAEPEGDGVLGLLDAERKNKETWQQMKDSGKYEFTPSPTSNSEYLIDRNTGDIYRFSDHWFRVASCDWPINDFHANQDGKGIFQIAKANIKDFKVNDRAKGNRVVVLIPPVFEPFKTVSSTRMTSVSRCGRTIRP